VKNFTLDVGLNHYQVEDIGGGIVTVTNVSGTVVVRLERDRDGDYWVNVKTHLGDYTDDFKQIAVIGNVRDAAMFGIGAVVYSWSCR
jgi:hypothetical protein